MRASGRGFPSASHIECAAVLQKPFDRFVQGGLQFLVMSSASALRGPERAGVSSRLKRWRHGLSKRWRHGVCVCVRVNCDWTD